MFNLLKSLLFGTPINYIHPSVKLGKGTKVWHYSVILQDCILGDNVNIGSNCELGKGCIIGNNVRIGSGSFLPPRTIVEDNSFIGPHVCMSDDFYPFVNNHNYKACPPILKKGCSLGAGVTLLPNVVIGERSLVGAGAVISRSIPNDVVIRGEPSRTIRLKL